MPNGAFPGRGLGFQIAVIPNKQLTTAPYCGDQVIRDNPASRGTEAPAEVLVGPPGRMVSNAGQQQGYEGGHPLYRALASKGPLRPRDLSAQGTSPPAGDRSKVSR